MSFCSRPGVEWIVSRSKCPDFKGFAVKFVSHVARTLKKGSRSPIPDSADLASSVAWNYVEGMCLRE